MKIYITSYGRGFTQPTYDQLAVAGMRPVLVVDKRDPTMYQNGFSCERGPYLDLRGKRLRLWRRHWKSKEPFMLLDDDMEFCKVRASKFGGVTIKPATARELHDMMDHVASLLHNCAQIGIHHRPFVNHAKRPHTYNSGTFPFRAMAYNPKLWHWCPRPCPTHSGSDIWLWHELVSQALDYAIVTGWCHQDRLYKPQPTHYTDAGKAKDFAALIYHMGIQNFVTKRSDGKRVGNIQYSRLAKYYREREDGTVL